MRLKIRHFAQSPGNRRRHDPRSMASVRSLLRARLRGARDAEPAAAIAIGAGQTKLQIGLCIPCEHGLLTCLTDRVRPKAVHQAPKTLLDRRDRFWIPLLPQWKNDPDGECGP
jgi:hypothetical protein